MIKEIIKKLQTSVNLERNDLENLVTYFESGNADDGEIKELLIAWNQKGYYYEEIGILSELINDKQGKIRLADNVFDICGTGGDKANTFNISTLSAIVLASIGNKVIKHSGRSSTSISGSVDVLEQFGVNFNLSREKKEYCFSKTGLLFVNSSLLRQLFSKAKQISKELGFPSFVNLLGPLTNPYKTDFHLIGAANLTWGELFANLLANSKTRINEKTLIVSSEVSEGVFLDELTLFGKNHLWIVQKGKIKYEVFTCPESNKGCFADLVIKNANDSLEVFEKILKGHFYNEKSIEIKALTVSLNVSAALCLARNTLLLSESMPAVIENIKSGKVWEHFDTFVTSNKVTS